MRIYELAKELGVENRVIIARAAELGMVGKSSHSNSLDPAEADLIRRAIIRQAVGPAPEREVVTTRVDKVTGETEAIVEKRKGNVIRRRRHAGPVPTEELSSGEEAAESAQAAAPSQSPSAEEAAPQTPTEPESEVAAAPTPIAEEQDETPEAAAPAPAAEESETAASPAAPATEGASAVEVKPEGTTRKLPAGAGPRVIGRIELPPRRVPRPSEPRRPAPPSEAPRSPVFVGSDESEGGKGRGRRAKGRKREIDRLDLLDYERREPRRGPKRQRESAQRREQPEANAMRASKRVVKLGEGIMVGDLAKQMSLKAGEVIAKLMELGVMATINQVLDKDTAQIVAEEFEYQVESTEFNEEVALNIEPEDPGLLKPRFPVVTVMGHVDHGKTSLLDAIRKTSVAAREHGGITQHIGAYTVRLDDERAVTFIDTPGHAAFTAMRARGAQVTDIVVLVVAADDGVMPQTIEAINHAKAAGVAICVAINKMDKPAVNPDRVKQQLAEHGVQPEEWGGDTMFFPVSALQGTGIRELLEGILLIAEVKELKANPDRRAAGAILEARQDRGRGTVATVLVQSGTLRVGDVFVAGAESGRVRSMMDDTGARLTEAGPSTAVEITGLNGMPTAGDDFQVVESESQARQVAASRTEKRKERERALASGPISLEEFAKRANNAAAAELPVILKADVHGSVEAVRDSLEQLSTDKVRVRVLHAAVGGVNESDVQLAIASSAIVVGFGVRAEPRVTEAAEQAGVELRFYRVIYELIDDVKKAMAGLLAPIQEEETLGRVEVRETFSIPKIGVIAGCFVIDGTVRRGAKIRLLRDSKVVYEGKMSSLKRFKDDVREVQAGYECGIGLEGYNDIKTGDMMEVYEVREVAATL